MKKINHAVLFLLLLSSGCATPPPPSSAEREIASADSDSCWQIISRFLGTSIFSPKITKQPLYGKQLLRTSSGVQIYGDFSVFKLNNEGEVIYYKTQGPTSASINYKRIDTHGMRAHDNGIASPLGLLKNTNKPLEDLTRDELNELGIIVGHEITLEYRSGIVVTGKLKEIVSNGRKNIVFSFEEGTVDVVGPQGEKLFTRSEGRYDVFAGKFFFERSEEEEAVHLEASRLFPEIAKVRARIKLKQAKEAARQKLGAQKDKKMILPLPGKQLLETSDGIQIKADFVRIKNTADNKSVAYYETDGLCDYYNSSQLIDIFEVSARMQPYRFAVPTGLLKGIDTPVAELSINELKKMGIEIGKEIVLEYRSGVVLKGKLKAMISENGKYNFFVFDNKSFELLAPDGEILADHTSARYDIAMPIVNFFIK